MHTCQRPQNMPITPHESMAGHWFSYNRLQAFRGGVCRTRPNRQTPPQRRSRGPGRPAQPRAAHLFLPRALEHSGKPANGSRGREIQRSTSCNPRILQGRGMFDGKAFLLGEGFSRGGSLFSIIFKLWYKRTPLTGKPRHERPPLPPQICLGYVLNLKAPK